MGVVPCLDEGLAQLNERFPKRDKSSDGSWGDKAHQRTASSHNGDKSGTPEWRDGDSKDEVRARDFDKDLKDAETGTTMEQVVQEWVRLCRAGKMWWVGYIIFNKRIWVASDGFKTHAYKGSNDHSGHVHVNSAFTNKADQTTGTDWGLKNFRRKAKPKPKPSTTKPKPPPVKPPTESARTPLVVDGNLGPKTIKRWQEVMGTTADGKISAESDLVEAVQERLKATVDRSLVVDGDGDSLAFGVSRKTIGALQRYLKVPVTTRISAENSETIKALQRRLNTGKF